MSDMKERRGTLIRDLAIRQMESRSFPDECSEAVKDAVIALVGSLMCDLKFDRDLLNETLMAYGWTPEDVEYFGIGYLFTE